MKIAPAAYILLNKNGSSSEKVSLRYDVIPGKSYSLKEAFQRSSINSKPSTISLILETTLNLTYHVYTCNETGKDFSPFVFYNRNDSKSLVYFEYYSQSREEKEIINFMLSQFQKPVKFVGLFVTS